MGIHPLDTVADRYRVMGCVAAKADCQTVVDLLADCHMATVLSADCHMVVALRNVRGVCHWVADQDQGTRATGLSDRVHRDGMYHLGDNSSIARHPFCSASPL